MNKKKGIAGLMALVVFGFLLVVLQHKVTQLSLEIPSIEESYHQKKQIITKLELDIRFLKNPKRLFEAQSNSQFSTLVFPRSDMVLALTIKQQASHVHADIVKQSSINLPLAKVFP